jgi:hypothetical protein
MTTALAMTARPCPVLGQEQTRSGDPGAHLNDANRPEDGHQLRPEEIGDQRAHEHDAGHFADPARRHTGAQRHIGRQHGQRHPYQGGRRLEGKGRRDRKSRVQWSVL